MAIIAPFELIIYFSLLFWHKKYTFESRNLVKVYFSSLNVKFSFSVYSMFKAIFRTSFTSDTGIKFMPDFTFSGISSKSF